MGRVPWGYAGVRHKSGSLQEDCHGKRALGICSRAIKVEAPRKIVMGRGIGGYAGGATKVEAPRKTVMGRGHWGYARSIKVGAPRKTAMGRGHWGDAGGPQK